ncbi:cytochrome C biogenesis protein [Rhizobium grahamii]|uniref:Cytochrome C biogenesis protein n=1 Tax=Rhizobium grahamii TaxID=1120045 RepID=A0A5Q0C5N0_9HYPH|nr:MULTISPECIES: protein-disulfide reductase DsbD domain-containing protein [Rhizobium]QFY59310.1 cytochrome C biogenesis protein [Rhizobium grahamii]QRM48160.1 cytochrome C biogenesis protein [Rhizobium sp. BG6]
MLISIRASHLILAALGLCLSFTAASAEMSAWADNEGGRMRLVALPPDAKGEIRAGLQVEPRSGWITYWREPGKNGIPPQITITPGSSVTLQEIRYPVPKHIVDAKVDEIAYDASVTFPLTLKATGAASEIHAMAFIGICKEICIPFQADLTLKLSPAALSRPEEEAILAEAEKRLPQPPSSDFAITGHTLSADGKSLTLEMKLPQSGETPPQVVVAGPSGYAFTRQIAATRTGNTAKATLAIGKLPLNYDVHGKVWSVLVIDGTRGMESPLAFE